MKPRPKKPKGRKPRHIKAWLEVNGEDCWPAVVCEKCGWWVDGIDGLAPYHTEMNYCERCAG